MIYKIFNSIEIEIDEEDLQRVSTALYRNSEWHLNEKTKQVVGWVRDPIRRKIILSRFILNCVDTNLYMDVDHIDKNRLNNQKSNLRLITHQENCFNARQSSNVAGAYFLSKKNRWNSKIRTKEGRIDLGRFKTKEEAEEAYRLAVIKYHGEFAR